MKRFGIGFAMFLSVRLVGNRCLWKAGINTGRLVLLVEDSFAEPTARELFEESDCKPAVAGVGMGELFLLFDELS